MDKAPQLNWNELPDFEPPAELWSRILSTKLGQERRRFRIQAAVMVSTTLALAVALVSVIGQPDTSVRTNSSMAQRELLRPADLLSELIEESRLLEARLRVIPRQNLPIWQRREIRLNRMRVALIDKEIARAYEEGMGAVGIESLWRERTDNMRQIIETYDQARLVTRI